MRGFALFVMLVALASCGSKTATTTSGSASTPAGTGSSAVGSAVTGSAAMTGSATAEGSAVAGSGSAAGSAVAGSAATLDPKFEALSAEERHTCGIYAGCKVESMRDDDPNAEAKEPTFENACLEVWVKLSAAEKKKIASCADKVGQCLGPPPCFDSMKL